MSQAGRRSGPGQGGYHPTASSSQHPSEHMFDRGDHSHAEDPYPEDAFPPEETMLGGGHHDYDEADIDADDQDFAYLPAPQLPPAQPPQQPKPQQQLKPQQQKPMPKFAMSQPRGRPLAPKVAQPMTEVNPFEDEPPAAPATSASAPPPSSTTTTRKRVAHQAPAQPTSGSTSPPLAAASPSSSSSASTSAPRPAASSLPHSRSTGLLDEMKKKTEHMFESGLVSLEKHSNAAWMHARGLDGVKKDTVDDELLTSLNYDDISDHVNEKALDEHSKHSGNVLTVLQLVITVLIAFLTAAAMYLVQQTVEYCVEQRVDNTLELILDGDPYAAYFAFLGFALFFAGIATVMVTFFAPQAKGGGVPYVQAYLNGTNVGSFFSPRIVLAKIMALPFTISSGLCLGMEGPFVFIGSGIAIIMVKALDLVSFRQRLGGKYARILKNINEERVFMAGGMAAGLAVAFNAPIAGVMMALEGSTAFLTVPVVLRIFGCAMFATFFNDLFHASGTANIKTHNLIIITSSSSTSDYVWVISDILVFVVIAVIGGCLGSLAIWINVRMTKWRHHTIEAHAPTKPLNTFLAISEVLALVFVISTLWFILPYMFGCRLQHEECFPTTAVPNRCMPVQCPDKYYSEIGTIVYSSADTIARILFDRSLTQTNDLSPFPLIVYAMCYLLFVAVGYGSFVPGGLFVPSVVVGGCMGRVVGWVVRAYISDDVNPGVYALLGAASMFGGFTRLALPAVIMLIEMTGDATYLLPIMFCTVLAKVVSDEIVPPLYPQHMAIEGLPTLGDKLNPLIARLSAKHIMNKGFISVNQVDTLTHILDVLDRSRSMLLPVTTRDGKFVGMIMRRNLIYALNFSTKYTDDAEIEAAAGGTTTGPNTNSLSAVEKKMGGWDDTTDYAKSIGQFDDKYAKALINLTPFMDAGALTAHEETSAKRISIIFRRLGISHLGVADASNKLVGVITRRHLIKPPVAATPLLAHRPAPEDEEALDHLALDLNDGFEVGSSTASVLAAHRRAASRRSHSVLMGAPPLVRFDDEEDEVDDHHHEGADEKMIDLDLDPTDPLYAESNPAFRDATSGAFDQAVGHARALADSAAAHEAEDSDGINTTGGGRPRKPQSSLSRLNAYTREL